MPVRLGKESAELWRYDKVSQPSKLRAWKKKVTVKIIIKKKKKIKTGTTPSTDDKIT